MAKRVSLKGRGADIFFGDYGPTTEPAVPPSTAEAAEAAEDVRASDEPEATPPEPEQAPEGSTAGRVSERQRGSTTSKLASKHSSLQASKQATKRASLQDRQGDSESGQTPLNVHASKQASLHASTSVGQRGQESVSHDDDLDAASDEPGSGDPANGGGDVGDFLAEIGEVGGEFWTRIDAAATITSSFRYTESELTALTDVLYEIGKQYGARVTKQDVARLALNAVLNEYYQRGPSSLLGRLAARRRRHTGGR